MEALAVAIRWTHLLAATLLVGVFAFLALVAPAATPPGGGALEALGALGRRLRGLACGALAGTLVSGLLDLWRQVAVATGRHLWTGGTGPDLGAVASVLTETRFGTVWLVRHALLVALALLLVSRSVPDRVVRWGGFALALLSLASAAAAGHAASAGWAPAAAIAVDAAHLGATGIWLGALLPLAWLLRSVRGQPAAAAVPRAAAAARRFSTIAGVSVLGLIATGLYNAWQQVAGIPGLVGTPYGRWLVVKLALLLPVLAVAAANRFAITPALARAAPARPEQLIARLARNVLAELAVGVAILGVVAVLGLSTPARHAPPVWPFPVRLSWAATKDLPGVETRVMLGAVIALGGVAAAGLATIRRRRAWPWVTALGAVVCGAGLLAAAAPLAVDAHPTTYLRPRVPYAAASIANGVALYREQCAACHGLGARGDGPAGMALRPRPADLTAPHTAAHTAGDLFWWLTHGIPGSAMPGFAERLGVDQRWDVINFLRLRAAAEAARSLSSVVDAGAWLAAPDFEYATDDGQSGTLKDLRGRSIVLLVLATRPAFTARFEQLAELVRTLQDAGVAILAVPLGSGPAAAPARGVPIVTDGAAEIAATYGLLGPDPDLGAPPPAHVEFLVDRQGYIRARWIPSPADPGWADAGRLLAQVRRLAAEPPRAAAPDEHVH